jgi:hypothetical protein
MSSHQSGSGVISSLRARLFAASILFAAASSLHAATYDNSTAFFAAADVELATGFEGIAIVNSYETFWNEMVVNDQLTLSFGSSYARVYQQSFYLTPSAVLTTPESATMIFEEGVTAVGFAYGLLSGINFAPDMVTVSVYDVVTGGVPVFSDSFSTANVYAGLGAFSYFGIEGVGLIQRIEITGSAGFSLVLDNISLPSAVPEPSSYGIIAGSAILMAAIGRRAGRRRC